MGVGFRHSSRQHMEVEDVGFEGGTGWCAGVFVFGGGP